MRRSLLRFLWPLACLATIAGPAPAQDDVDDEAKRRVTEPGRGPQIPFDESRWEFWWFFNQERYVGLRPSIQKLAGQNPDVDEPFRPVTEEDRETSLLPRLVQALRDSDPSVRIAALHALAKTRDPDARPYLFNGLRDKEFLVRIQAILALGVWGNTVSLPRLEEILKDDGRELQERMVAAVSIGLIGGPLAAESFKAFLAPRSFLEYPVMVRAGLAYGVGLTRDPENAPLVRALLSDRSTRDYVVHAYLLLSLGKCGGPDDAKTLLRALGHDETQLRRSAAIALGVLRAGEGDDKAVAALANAARNDADLMVKNFAYLAIGQIGGEQAGRELVTDLAQTTRANKPFIALALGILADPEHVPLLLKELAAVSDTSYRAALAVSLGLHRDNRAAPALREAFAAAGEPVLRGYVALALGLVGDVDSIERMERSLAEANDVELVPSLASGLALLGARTTAGRITALLKKERNEFVKQSLLYALGRIGDRSAIEPLGRFLAEKGGDVAYVREYAAVGLGLLSDPHPVRAVSRLSQDSNYTIQSNFLNPLFTVP
ncbi:MAG: HEAT repeat domain-containing protein [Planctomycetota bacterium JB042]